MAEKTSDISITIPSERELDSLTDIFSIFADSTRIRIICALGQRELSVNQICEAVKMSQPAISHQLRVLKGSRLVKCRRDGRSSFYSLADDHVEAILAMGQEHIKEEQR